MDGGRSRSGGGLVIQTGKRQAEAAYNIENPEVGYCV